MPGVDPRQHPRTKGGEVALELPRAADAGPNEVRVGIPEISGIGFKSAPATSVERLPVVACS